jgi:hypothetical protein
MKELCGTDTLLILNCKYFILLKGAYDSNMKVYAMRLCPGVEIKSSLLEFVTSNMLNAAFILSCCGSVRKATLRFATSADQTHKVCYINTINNNLSNIFIFHAI